MKKQPNLLLAAAIAITFASCGNDNTSQETAARDTTAAPAGVTLTDVPASKDFPDARLSLKDAKPTVNGDSVKVDFTFDVKGYELKNQTDDDASKSCANSKDGQHIHFILDNKPYTALYEPKHSVTLAKGSDHYLLAFLSRSYHLSLKHEGAALLYHFRVNDQGRIEKLEDPKTPMVFYSRPKGDYVGKDTDNLLLDFYLWNAKLGPDYKVQADVNGQVLTIDNWKPYFLKGLPMGKNSIRLTLVDKNGDKVTGDNTEVTREFNLAQQEPMN